MTVSQRASSSHPSYLALDRAALGAPAAEVARHLATCEECRRYVDALGETPPASGILPIRTGIARSRRNKLRARWMGASALAAAACLLLVVGRTKPPTIDNPTAYLGAKGFSSVWIYVKHGPTTTLWDGKQPLVSGDRLRIKVEPAGYRRVEVYSVKTPDAPELLYSGSVAPAQSITLPDAWEIDSEPGAERLMVVFSNEQVLPNWSQWLRGEVEPGVVVLPFVLPKKADAISPDASGGP
jgi:hypothetical protein